MTFLGKLGRQLSVLMVGIVALSSSTVRAIDVNPQPISTIGILINSPYQMDRPVAPPPVPSSDGQTNTAPIRIGVDTVSSVVDQTKDIVYYLQPNLQLGEVFTHLFTFNLQGVFEGGAQAQVPDGYYSLDIAILLPIPNQSVRDRLIDLGITPSEDPYSRFISSSSQFVYVANGRVKAIDIGLDFPYVTATALANSIYFQFTPVNEWLVDSSNNKVRRCLNPDNNYRVPSNSNPVFCPRNDYKPFVLKTWVTPNYPITGQGSIQQEPEPLDPQHPDLRDFITEARNRRERALAFQKIQRPTTYAKNNHLTYMKAQDANLTRWSKYFIKSGPSAAELITQIIRNENNLSVYDRNYSGLWSTLCAAMADNNQWYKEAQKRMPDVFNWANLYNRLQMCAIIPHKVMQLSIVNHVYAFEDGNGTVNRPYAKSGGALQVFLQNSFSVGRSHSENSSFNFSWTSAAQFFGRIGANVTYSQVDGTSTGSSGSVAGFLGLDYNDILMHVPISHSERCLEVSPIASSRSDEFYDSTPGATNGLYICLGESSERYLTTEEYVHAYIGPHSNADLAPNSQFVQWINAALEGKHDILEFKSALQKNITNAEPALAMPPDQMGAVKRYDNLALPRGANNLIIKPLDYVKDQPNIFQKIFGIGYKEEFIQ